MTRQPRTAPRPEHTPARGARAGWDRLLAAIRRNPLLADAAVAAAVLALLVPGVITPPGGIRVLALVLYTAQAVLLVFRRRYPFGVFLLIFVLAVVTANYTTEGLNGIALLVAFYTVAAYKPRGVVLAAVMMEALVVLLVTFASAGVQGLAAGGVAAGRLGPERGGRVRRLLRPHPARLPRGRAGPGRAAGA